LLTQSEILEKETLPPEKEADQHAEAEPDQATMVRIYDKTVVYPLLRHINPMLVA